MSVERYCPECGEVVPAGIVRHRQCYLLAADRLCQSTEREWRHRFWGDREPVGKGGDSNALKDLVDVEK